ncbi:MAG: ADP-ribosylglycohydrolase family protein [Paenibacillus sp.]|nr:ADP-ribosylglycohydrolase family protein [Paenibacillus sp.]
MAAWDTEIIVHPEQTTAWVRPTTVDLAWVNELWSRKATANRYLLPEGSWRNPDAELVIDYGPEGPAIGASQSRVLCATFTNHSKVPIEGTLSLTVPEGWTAPTGRKVELTPGASVHWEMVIQANEQVKPVNTLVLTWRRMHDHTIWAEQHIDFTLVAAAPWRISSSSDEQAHVVYVAGDRLVWASDYRDDANTVYHAESIVNNPLERTLCLIAAANGPVRVKLDGVLIIHSSATHEFMPAYHRAPKEQQVELKLAAGRHKIEIEAQRPENGKPPEVYVLLVGTRATSSPGPCYYYIDMEWQLDES